MAGMPTRVLNLPNAATDNSETPATAFAGTGLGAGLNQLIDDAKGTGLKVGSGTSSPSAGKVLRATGVADADGNQQSAWGQVQTADVATGAIATANLAANATSQGSDAVGSAVSPTTTSAALVDMTDMTVTLTLVAGSEVEVTLWAVVANSTLGAVDSFAIRDDTAGVDGTSYSINAPVAGYAHAVSVSARYTGLAAGSRTFKGRWSANSGTLTANGVARRLRVREFKK